MSNNGDNRVDNIDSAEFDLVVHAHRALTPAGSVSADIAVRGGVIVAIEPLGSLLKARHAVTLGRDETLIPGLVDTHVHINEPGRTEWEGFASATRAAAAGGVTTLVDMPLNSIPPTTNPAALALKRDCATGQIFVDVGFWGGAIPGNVPQLRALHEEGVFGFKSFLLHSGVDEFPCLSADQLEEDLAELVRYDALMIVHAEDATIIEHAPPVQGKRYADFLASRPKIAENAAIAEVIELARRTGARVHILHLSSAEALPLISQAKRDGVRLTVETCPHYLTLTAEQVPDAATAYKCCPPIREAANRELLWQGLLEGTIDCIVSDHSPSTPELKDLRAGDFGVAWGGISSVQLGLPVVWTEARKRKISLEQVVNWMSARPAALIRLPQKGQIAVGCDADFAIFAADESWVVDAATLEHKNPITPYHGLEVTGVVRATYLRGERIVPTLPHGRLLRRGFSDEKAFIDGFSLQKFRGDAWSCLAVKRWVEQVVGGAPYRSTAEMLAFASSAADSLTQAEIDEALTEHPRIGDKPTGETQAQIFSRREQSSLDEAGEGAELAAELAEGNRAYESRFNRVFLIRAAGRSRAEILSELNRRLLLDEQTERHIVAAELRDIALLRLNSLYPVSNPDSTSKAENNS